MKRLVEKLVEKKKIQSLVLSGNDAFKDPIFLFVFGNKIELLEV